MRFQECPDEAIKAMFSKGITCKILADPGTHDFPPNFLMTEIQQEGLAWTMSLIRTNYAKQNNLYVRNDAPFREPFTPRSLQVVDIQSIVTGFGGSGSEQPNLAQGYRQ